MTNYKNWKRAAHSYGTIESINVNSVNGFAAAMDSPTGPNARINMQTSVTGMLKGNGVALLPAVLGTDYLAPISSPTLDNIVTQTSGGAVKNSGKSITTDPMSNDDSHVPTTAAMYSAIGALVDSPLKFINTYDASVNTFPTVGSGTGGIVEKANYWSVSVGGTMPGGAKVYPNDAMISLIDNPGQNPLYWAINGAVSKDYVDAQLLLKANLNGASFTGAVTVLTPVNPTEVARKDYVDTGLSAKEPTITTLPATKGGTGLNLYTIGDFIYANTTTSLAKLAAPAIGCVIISNGAGIAPSWSNAPAFAGNPTAQNITAGDTSLKLANTNFVAVAILAAAPSYTNVAAAGNVNLTNLYLLTTQNVDGSTMRLPDAATTLINAIYTIKLIGPAANAVITVPTGQYLNDVLNGTVSIVATPGAVASFRSNGANYWVQVDNTAALGLKANSASPALTGTPTAPTPTFGDNTTKIPTTSFVQSAILAAAPAYTNVAASGNINLTSEYPLTTQNADGSTMRLPDAATTLINAIYTIKLIGPAANAVITVPTGQYLNDVLNGTVSIVATPGAVASFRSNGANYWVQVDNTAALGLKANLSGGATFTGNIIVPDQSAGDNSSKAANTKYIDYSLLTFNNINGLKLSWASNTTLGLTSGYWNVIGSSIMFTSPSVTIDITHSGVVNGLDTGSAANSTNYYVYAIAHGTTPSLNGAILSTNSTTPTLPSGYTSYRNIGRVRRDGSGIFIPFIQTGNGNIRTITYNGAMSTTQVGAGLGSKVFAALSLSNFVPPGCRRGVLRFDKTTTVASSYFAVRESGSSVTELTSLRSLCTGAANSSIKLLIPFICNFSQSIEYTLSDSGDSANVYVESYEQEL